MPVKLLSRHQGRWHERGVVWREPALGGPAQAQVPGAAGTAAGASVGAVAGAGALAWEDRPTELRPPCEVPGAYDYLTEIHPQAEAFVRTLADRLERGAAFFPDYGFPESEYFHPQRHMGTLMCHQAHRSDSDPLQSVGLKDITAHVDFTGVALAAQEVGLEVLGYTSQAHFLLNSGLLGLLENASIQDKAMAQKLITEHEMGELFKVIALGRGQAWQPLGFVQGDRTHRL
jgi:SAM-dependent MidA family methyltransferase